MDTPWETREGWPLLTVETAVNGASKSTNEMGPSLVGSLGSSCRHNRFLYSLGRSSRLSTKYFFLTIHYFNSFVPIVQQPRQAVVQCRLSLNMCLFPLCENWPVGQLRDTEQQSYCLNHYNFYFFAYFFVMLMTLLRTSLISSILIIGARPRIKPVTYPVATLVHHTFYILLAYLWDLLYYSAVQAIGTHTAQLQVTDEQVVWTLDKREKLRWAFWKQCWRSVTLRIRIRGSLPLTNGSGSGPHPDPTQDPTTFFSDFKDAIFFSFFIFFLIQ